MAEVALVSVWVFMSLSFLLGMLMMKLMNCKGFSTKKSDLTLIEHRWGVVIVVLFFVLIGVSMIWLIPYLNH